MEKHLSGFFWVTSPYAYGSLDIKECQVTLLHENIQLLCFIKFGYLRGIVIVCSEHLLKNAYLCIWVTILFTASYVIVLLTLTKTAEKSFSLKKKEQQLQPHEVNKERNTTLAFKSHFPAPRTSVLTPFLLFHWAIQKQFFSLTYCPNETWNIPFTSQLKDRAKCRGKRVKES